MKNIILATSLLFATGCHLQQVFNPQNHIEGTQVTQQQINSFKPGVTTISEVEAELGAPQDIKLLGNEKIYVYNYSVIKHYGQNVSESTNFTFDANSQKLVKVLKGKGSSNNPLLK